MTPEPARQILKVGAFPAAKITGNLVDSRRGPALSIYGEGPMSVEDNRFQAVDILGDFDDASFATVDQYVGKALVVDGKVLIVVDAVPVLDGRAPPECVSGCHRADLIRRQLLV